ncbi:hypothetical protein [Streptomyces sp. NPDC001089]
MGDLRIQHFDMRQDWNTYCGQTWPIGDKARAIHDAREFYTRSAHLWIGGVRLVDRAGRIVWSIAARPTYRIEMDWGRGRGWEPIGHEGWALEREDAERGRDKNAARLNKPTRIVLEDYPREAAPVETVEAPAFSAPEIQPAVRPAGRQVAPVIFQFGEGEAA